MGFPPLRVCAGICEPQSIITTTKTIKSLRQGLSSICNPFGKAVILDTQSWPAGPYDELNATPKVVGCYGKCDPPEHRVVHAALPGRAPENVVVALQFVTVQVAIHKR